MDNDFQVSWTKWKIRYIFNLKKYYTKRKRDIWNEINSHKLDKLLDQLAQIYLQASPAEKNAIEEYVKKRDQLSWELVLYVRRVALRLQTKKEEHLIYWALGIVLLASKCDDPRDVLNSLILLKIGAEKVGLDLKSWYEKVYPTALSDLQSIFYREENRSEKSISITINKFGPPGWALDHLINT
jgi:hypothetical protein